MASYQHFEQFEYIFSQNEDSIKAPFREMQEIRAVIEGHESKWSDEKWLNVNEKYRKSRSINLFYAYKKMVVKIKR